MWVNQYKDSGWLKSLLKEAYYLARFASLFIANGFRVKTVLFYPEFPIFKTQINAILRHSGYNITNNPQQRFDLVVAWQDTTFRTPQPLLDGLAASIRVVNANCGDISKQRVEQAQQRIFGYGTHIDPLQYEGPCVRKSNLNGHHYDTEIVQCPLNFREQDSVYQRLLNNQSGPDTVEDIRVHIFGPDIAYLILRQKPLAKRFYGDFKARIATPPEYLSHAEMEQLLALAQLMSLDYGEMDVIRDRDDGRLYVLDVNNTPYSPPHGTGLSRRDRALGLQLGRQAFEAAFLGGRNANNVSGPTTV